MKPRCLCFIAAIIVSVSGCSSETKVPTAPEPLPANQPAEVSQARPVASEPDQSVADCIRTLPFIEKAKKTGMLRVWQAVGGRDKYRMLCPADQRIPDAVIKASYWGDPKFAARSYDYGEMSGAHGLIAFIVDKTITSEKKFSLVVFIERPGVRYSLYWVYQDADLSQVTLNRHSGNVYLERFRENESPTWCDVKWDRSQKKWACNLK